METSGRVQALGFTLRNSGFWVFDAHPRKCVYSKACVVRLYLKDALRKSVV